MARRADDTPDAAGSPFEPAAEATLVAMPMPVEVVRSRKRRKTVQAVVVDGRIRVHVPAWMSKADEAIYVADLVARLEKRFRSEHIDLTERARQLARKHRLPEAHSIRWSEVQRSRWGSCSVHTGDIRISSRLANWPTWVLDYVIVHELAHLVEANHSRAFHALVDRYPLAERAKGFLIAKGLGDSEEPDGDGADDEPTDIETTDIDVAANEVAAIETTDIAAAAIDVAAIEPPADPPTDEPAPAPGARHRRSRARGAHRPTPPPPDGHQAPLFDA